MVLQMIQYKLTGKGLEILRVIVLEQQRWGGADSYIAFESSTSPKLIQGGKNGTD